LFAYDETALQTTPQIPLTCGGWTLFRHCTRITTVSAASPQGAGVKLD
jgi:hypothetical protein